VHENNGTMADSHRIKEQRHHFTGADLSIMCSSLELAVLYCIDLIDLINQELGHEALLIRADVGAEGNDFILPPNSSLGMGARNISDRSGICSV
jgi:hypothetical protein